MTLDTVISEEEGVGEIMMAWHIDRDAT